jgi:hypothetical protein
LLCKASKPVCSESDRVLARDIPTGSPNVYL